MATQVQIILARDVPNLGRVGELHKVRAGYARNYLFPKGFALPASEKHVSRLEHQRKLIEHKMGLLRSESERKSAEIQKMQFTCNVKVGANDKIFGSVTARDIADELKNAGIVIDHRDLKMEGPLKTLGLHTIALRLEADVQSEVKVLVAGEKIEDAVEDEPEANAQDVAASDVEPEDLTKIEGVGPKIAEVLNANGVLNYIQLANTNPTLIKEWLTNAEGNFAAHTPDTWPKQAELAANGEWDELKAWQDELDGGKVVE